MTSRRPGRFIVFEGGEGAGKTTQIKLLAAHLATCGIDTVETREPGSGALGARLRQILLDPDTGAIHPRTEALLFAADRAEHVHTHIRPRLHAGEWVLCDRYIDSSVAYQSAGRGLVREEILHLSMWATESLLPDLTIVLDLDPVVGLQRSTRDEFNRPDRFESEKLDFAHAVRHAFLESAARDPHRYLVVDASLPPERVTLSMVDGINKRLEIVPPQTA